MVLIYFSYKINDGMCFLMVENMMVEEFNIIKGKMWIWWYIEWDIWDKLFYWGFYKEVLNGMRGGFRCEEEFKYFLLKVYWSGIINKIFLCVN